MRYTLKKTIDQLDPVEGSMSYVSLSGDELRTYLRETLPLVMADISDPDIDPDQPEVYLDNLFSNRLGDFDERYIIVRGDNPLEGLLLGIKKEDHLHILTLGVKKEYRGRGYGRDLINACMRDMVEEGIQRLVLNVHRDNHMAVSLYSKLGFTNINQ